MLSRWFKRLAAPSVAVALFAGGAVASADTVAFSTTGAFNPTAPGVPVGTSPVSYSFYQGATELATVTYTGNSQSLDMSAGDVVTLDTTAGPGSVNLGQFQVTFDANSYSGPKFQANVPFELTITQTNPTSGTGYSDGTVNGTINLSDKSGALYATFTVSSPSVMIGDIIYAPASSTTLSATQLNNGPTALGGTITYAPLPATASMGLSMLGGLGLLGGLSALRRRRMA